MLTFYKNFSLLSPVKEEEITLRSGIKISISKTRIIIEMPMPCTDSFFYKKNKKSLEISNDIRLMIEDNEELDSAGITSCLLLGIAVAPLSPYKNIQTFIPGYKYIITTKDFEFKSGVNCHWSNPSENDYTLEIGEQATLLAKQIDKTMIETCPSEDPLILFSGGVDSSILAYRASEMGWKKTTLVHFSFGEKDPETHISKKIASILRLPIDIIFRDKSTGYECLENAGSLFRQIFCDISTVPTYIFNQVLMSKYDNTRTNLNGTGADGAYGTFSTVGSWQKLDRIPQPIIRSIGGLYDSLQIWRNPSKLESAVKIFKRFAFLPKFICIAAFNPMLNITYHVSDEDIITVSNSLNNWLQSISQSEDNLELIPLIKIAIASAGNQIQKNDPLIQRSYRTEYPFLDHEMVDLALQHARFWPGNNIPKKALKYMLSKSIPRELVYRKKQGFLSPLAEEFSHPVFLEHVEKVIEPDSPLNKYVNNKNLTQLLDYLSSGKELALQTYNTVWSITFANAWLSQVEQISKKLKQDYIALHSLKNS